jgi:prepilin-type N-terminal cleavage/methylation domain-containing protein
VTIGAGAVGLGASIRLSRGANARKVPVMRRAFTLIELLVVIAIIAILAAILFPVFSQARKAAQKITCSSNFNQIGKGLELYNGDNNQKYPLFDVFVGHWYPPDKPWSWTIQPYVKSWGVLVCPSDPNKDRAYTVDEQRCPPGDRDCEYYGMATRTDFGLSMQYVTPLVSEGGADYSKTIKSSMVQAPSKMILAVDSIWGRDPTTGAPTGGGNWGLDPPARIAVPGNIDTFPWPGAAVWWFGGWNPGSPLAWNVYGGSWPWHGDLVNVIFIDTHVRALRIPQLAAGCDVRDGWGGTIYDREAYLWDLL